MSRTVKNYPDHQALQALAAYHGLSCVDLADIVLPGEVIELMPESVARENVVLPLAVWDGILFVALSDPTDFDRIQKLQFILNKDIQPVLAACEQIIEAINRHYGQSETESVDSLLSEFTDTAIDFTRTETLKDEEEHTDFDATEAPCGYSVRRRQPESASGAGERRHVVQHGMLLYRVGPFRRGDPLPEPGGRRRSRQPDEVSPRPRSGPPALARRLQTAVAVVAGLLNTFSHLPSGEASLTVAGVSGVQV